MNKEIEIPEGYEARIESNKVIFEPKESEDERIRKMLIEQMERWKKCAEDNNVEQDIKDASAAIAYLEKQKEAQPGDEDRYMEGYMNGMNDALKEQKPIPTKDEKDFLEKEVKAFLCNYDKEFDDDAPTYDIAEHFYQLGKNSQKSAEWSEEDEAMYNAFTCEVINEKMNPTLEQVKWIRNLRDRLKYLRPQPHWKPSEEEIGALAEAMERNDKIGYLLHQLHEELKCHYKL